MTRDDSSTQPLRSAPSPAWRGLLDVLSAAACSVVLVLGMARAMQEREPESAPAQRGASMAPLSLGAAAAAPPPPPAARNDAPAGPGAPVITRSPARAPPAAQAPTLPTRAVLAGDKPSRLAPLAADGTAPEPPADAN